MFNLKARQHSSNLREVSMRLTCCFFHFEDRKPKCCVHVSYFGEVSFLRHSNLKSGISFKSNHFTPQGKEEKKMRWFAGKSSNKGLPDDQLSQMPMYILKEGFDLPGHKHKNPKASHLAVMLTGKAQAGQKCNASLSTESVNISQRHMKAGRPHPLSCPCRKRGREVYILIS